MAYRNAVSMTALCIVPRTKEKSLVVSIGFVSSSYNGSLKVFPLEYVSTWRPALSVEVSSYEPILM